MFSKIEIEIVRTCFMSLVSDSYLPDSSFLFEKIDNTLSHMCGSNILDIEPFQIEENGLKLYKLDQIKNFVDKTFPGRVWILGDDAVLSHVSSCYFINIYGLLRPNIELYFENVKDDLYALKYMDRVSKLRVEPINNLFLE